MKKQTEIILLSISNISMLLLLSIIHIEILFCVVLYILAMFCAKYGGLMD